MKKWVKKGNELNDILFELDSIEQISLDEGAVVMETGVYITFGTPLALVVGSTTNYHSMNGATVAGDVTKVEAIALGTIPMNTGEEYTSDKIAILKRNAAIYLDGLHLEPAYENKKELLVKHLESKGIYSFKDVLPSTLKKWGV